MVPDGSMTRPLPIAPLDMVWTGYWCTEYIPGVDEERAAELAGSCLSSRRDDGRANGARARGVREGEAWSGTGRGRQGAGRRVEHAAASRCEVR
jgi:hypothetical protein